MSSGHRLPKHGRKPRRLERTAIIVSIPVALALIAGFILAIDPGKALFNPTAAGSTATPSPAAPCTNPAPSASPDHPPSSDHPASWDGPASADQSPSASPDQSPCANPAPSASPDQSPSASATPTQSAAQSPPAAQNMNCQLIVPANPLTAQGLATPYQLEGPAGMTSPQQSGCTMANAANLGAFVQATILDPATGKLSTYEPLVITKGTRPAVNPVVPKIPQDAVVTVDIGFNGNTLNLVGATPDTLAGAHAVTGLPGSPFGQVSFLNGVRFFRAAFRAERQGKLTIPPIGNGNVAAGKPCPTTRSFTMVDQDPSDNVTTQYLVNGNGQTAQNTAANRAALQGATLVSNGSDNFLLGFFLDPALGCQPFTAPNLTNGGQPGTSQALDELSAASNQKAPLALVPVNDPMTLVNDDYNIQKTNLFRASVGQPLLPAGNTPTETLAIENENAATFCQNMLNIQTTFLAQNQGPLQNFASPVPATGNNLFTFMANRLNMSFTNLGCATFGLHNPVQVTLNGNGTAIAATLNTTPQVADASLGTGGNPTAQSQHNRGQNTGQQGQIGVSQG